VGFALHGCDQIEDHHVDASNVWKAFDRRLSHVDYEVRDRKPLHHCSGCGTRSHWGTRTRVCCPGCLADVHPADRVIVVGFCPGDLDCSTWLAARVQ
jgi:hypothetical protein